MWGNACRSATLMAANSAGPSSHRSAVESFHGACSSRSDEGSSVILRSRSISRVDPPSVERVVPAVGRRRAPPTTPGPPGGLSRFSGRNSRVLPIQSHSRPSLRSFPPSTLSPRLFGIVDAKRPRTALAEARASAERRGGDPRTSGGRGDVERDKNSTQPHSTWWGRGQGGRAVCNLAGQRGLMCVYRGYADVVYPSGPAALSPDWKKHRVIVGSSLIGRKPLFAHPRHAPLPHGRICLEHLPRTCLTHPWQQSRARTPLEEPRAAAA